MADAKIVDIKGIQWELKDEVARSRITTLEENNSAQGLSEINININKEYSATKAILSSRHKIGKIHFATIVLQNINGNNIGTTNTAFIGKVPLNLFDTVQTLLFNAYNSVVVRCYITKDGNIAIAESAGVPAGNNYLVGEIVFVEQ